MMLDNKNEQKWPLTEKEVLKKEQTVKGHFFCAAAGGRIFFMSCSGKKEKSGIRRPTYSAYHTNAGMSIEYCA